MESYGISGQSLLRREIGLVDRIPTSEDSESEQENAQQNQEDYAPRPTAITRQLKSTTDEEKAGRAQKAAFEKDPAVAGWLVI